MLSLKLIKDCKAVLEEFSNILKRYSPQKSKKATISLQALLWGLKNETRRNLMSRLTRQKNDLELALVGLSVYVCHNPS